MATAGLPLWSTTAANNGTADPAVNWAEGMAPSAVNDSSRAEMASVAKWRDDLYGITAGLSTGGTSTAFTVTTNSTYATAAVMSGAILTIIPHTDSGAAPTLAVDGLTARALNVSTGVAVPTGALISGTPYFVRYKHASTEFIVIGASKDVLASLDIIGGTQNTSIAIDDTLPTYDLSATANRRMLVSDFLKVVNLLTADATPDRAADYVMTYDASASAAKKVLLSNLPSILPRGYIDGCGTANGTDATNDIDFSAGVCRDSTNTVDITCAAMAGKQLDANWAPGASAGMRNSAVGIADTTYHLWAVAKADGTQDYYAHTSTVAATVLTALQAESGGSAYIYGRLIMSIVRASASIRAYTQVGGEVLISTPLLDISNGATGTSANTGTLASIPTGLKLLVFLNLANASATVLYVSSLDQTDLPASATSAPLGQMHDSANVSTGFCRVMTNTSAQFRYRTSGDSSVKMSPTGFIHPRGTNA